MAAANGRKISASSARAHTRRSKQSKPFSLTSGITRKLFVLVLAGLGAWAYQAIQPPPPRICGSQDGPPVTSSRIELKDGRFLSYKESGVPREKAKYKIIFIHGMDSSKYGGPLLSPEVFDELGVYLLSFDRSGYGESDPNPNMSIKSTVLDIEELADKLELGSKFFIFGHSMGAAFGYGCLKYIPHRIAGAALLSPASNYWWPGFPANLSKETFSKLLVADQWALRVSHYAPWLTYWWNTQKLFTPFSVVKRRIEVLSTRDKEHMQKILGADLSKTRQQGEFESIHRDLNVIFGRWEFDPMELENPFPNHEGSVLMWQGTEDMLVPVNLPRYIAKKLPWIRYHEVPNEGHLLTLVDGLGDEILKELLIRDH